MGKLLTNDFSWSKSRHEKFAECRRAYYLHYYASWGGWDALAPPRARELYTLKRLSNRFSWGGSIVHDAIRGALQRLRNGHALDRGRLVERMHGVMRTDFAFSRDRRYWREKYRKEFVGLVEHEYGEPVAAEAWKQNWDNVKAALEWFFDSRWVPLARGLERRAWLEVDLMDFDRSVFFLDGVKVFAVPDFAFLDADGRPHVVDWKTGRAREGYDDQVLGYALYLHHRYRLPLAGMRATLVYVNDGVEQTVPIEAGPLEAFKAKFTQSVAAMREALADPAANVPRPEDAFARTDDLLACARCPFRRPCGRERAAREAVARA